MNIINCAKCGNYTMEDTENKGAFEGLCPTCKAEITNEVAELSAHEAIECFTYAIKTIYDEYKSGEEPTLSAVKKMQTSYCQWFELETPV